MAIHTPDGRIDIHVAKLDTASAYNLITRELALDIGLHVENYAGPDLPMVQPLGPAIYLKSRVTLDWHVSERRTRHTTTFGVLEDDHSRPKFSVLLGQDEVEKVGFYLQNHDVFFIQ